MIKKTLSLVFVFLTCSCSGIEFVLKDDKNQLKDKVLLVFSSGVEEQFSRELYSSLGNSESFEYILETTFIENKENRIVKSNQVAEKIDYELVVVYNLFYKTKKCTIVNKKIITKFSFTPKSDGYNFSSDVSLNKLYVSSIRNNIQKFISLSPFEKTCL